MTQEVDDPEIDNPEVDKDDGDDNNQDDPNEIIKSLEKEVQNLRAEAASQRKLKQRLSKDLDELKAKGNNSKGEESFKSLYEQEKQAREALERQARETSIQAAVNEQLSQVGVQPDVMKAASKLINKDLIDWDAQEGLDKSSVESAVALLKSEYPVLFETKVPSTKPKVPSDGKTSSSKEITRSEFNKLPLVQQAEIATTHTIVDD